MPNTARALTEEVSQWVTFRLGEEVYGINVMQVQEVLRVGEIAPVPGAQEHVLGIINLRGSVVTVIDARRRFGLPEKDQDDYNRIIIVESQNQVMGIMVDSVAEVADIPESDIDATPSVGSNDSAPYIQGVFSMEHELLVLVNTDELFQEGNLENS